MANVGIYFNREELHWIKQHEEGYVRQLVIADMNSLFEEPEMTEEERAADMQSALDMRKSEETLAKEINKREKPPKEAVCKKCGAMLPYFGAKTCKMCKAKQ
jgi:ribosomal protein L40E